MLVVETDDGALRAVEARPQRVPLDMVEQTAKPRLWGAYCHKALNDRSACITRFHAMVCPFGAAPAALYNDLDIIADYEAARCDSGTHSCADHEH
jgi:hypothetical protein